MSKESKSRTAKVGAVVVLIGALCIAAGISAFMMSAKQKKNYIKAGNVRIEIETEAVNYPF